MSSPTPAVPERVGAAGRRTSYCTSQAKSRESMSPSSSSTVTVAVPVADAVGVTGVVGVPETTRDEVSIVTPAGSPVAV